MAPRGEKELYKAVQTRDVGLMDRVGQEHPQFALAAATLTGCTQFVSGDSARARQLLGWVFSTGQNPASDPFVAKYVSVRMEIEVVPGVSADLPLNRDTVGLALAELHQDAEDIAAAIDVVEQLEPTQFTALSLAELYAIGGRFSDIVEITNGVTNDDDCTALLAAFRGVAFREQEFFDAARESFKEALKSKKRSSVVRHRALLERSRCYEAEGKRAMARKDLERIMSEDANYEGLAQALQSLGS
jgi:tetratricopeptide (TPR) repeat protein